MPLPSSSRTPLRSTCTSIVPSGAEISILVPTLASGDTVNHFYPGTDGTAE